MQMTGDYVILSVEAVETPAKLSGVNWHRYTIGQGDNRIVGYQQGEIATVNESVRRIVDQLNERRLGYRGRVQLNIAAYGHAED